MNGKFEPKNQFEQWVVDNFSILHRSFNNHLSHHTKIEIAIALAVIAAVVKMVFLK